jgi:hypothetical protein
MRYTIALLAVIALGAATGCSSNPCADAGPSDLCVILTVKTDNSNLRSLQQLNVAATVDGTAIGMHRSPPDHVGDYSLPFDIGLIFPGTDDGRAIDLVVDGVANGSFTAEGVIHFTLTGSRQKETVLLDGAPRPPPDMSPLPPPDLTPQSTDMGMLVTTPLTAGSFDRVLSSDNVIATITHADQTLQLYNPAGTLLVSLDKGVDISNVIVTDNIVIYCVSFVAIGTTGNQSCTLKMWKPGSANATTLGSGVYPVAAVFSSDGNTIAWRQNVDSTAMKGDIIASINGTQTTLATQMPLSNSWIWASTNVVFATIPSPTAGQFDVARMTTGTPVRICQNCDQVILSSDASMVAARAAVSGSVGRVAVGAASINTTNGLMPTSPNSDVTRLVDYFPGSVSYLASGALKVYDTGAGTVTQRDSGIAFIWFTTQDMVAFSSKARASDGSGDLWLVSKSAGVDQLFSAGPGVAWDYSGDDYFTFNEQPTSGPSNYFVNAGHGVSSTPLFTLKAPTSDGVYLDANHVVCFNGTKKMVIQDFTLNRGFLFNSAIVDYDVDRGKKRLLFIIQNGSSGDGIYQYNY